MLIHINSLFALLVCYIFQRTLSFLRSFFEMVVYRKYLLVVCQCSLQSVVCSSNMADMESVQVRYLRVHQLLFVLFSSIPLKLHSGDFSLIQHVKISFNSSGDTFLSLCSKSLCQTQLKTCDTLRNTSAHIFSLLACSMDSF